MGTPQDPTDIPDRIPEPATSDNGKVAEPDLSPVVEHAQNGAVGEPDSAIPATRTSASAGLGEQPDQNSAARKLDAELRGTSPPPSDQLPQTRDQKRASESDSRMPAATVSTGPGGTRVSERRSLSKLLSSAGEWSENIRKLLLNSIIILLMLLLVWTAYREMRQKTVVINPIDVPEELSRHGHSPTVVALRLNDGILKMLDGGSSYFRKGEVVPPQLQADTERPDIDVPGGNISLRTVIRYFRYAFNLPEPRVGGSISKEGDQFHLLLRQDNGHAKVLKATSLDELLTMGAEEVTMVRSPLLAAGYFLEHPERDKDFIKAETALNYESANKPNQAIVFYMLGEVFKNRNQLEKASANYEKATSLDSNEPAFYNNWGNVLGRLRNHQGSIEKYQKAAELMGDNGAVPHRNWCSALINLGKPEEALNQCAIAVQLRSDYANAYHDWGAALYDLQRYGEAIAKYQKAVELDSRLHHAYRGWAMSLASLNKFDEAIEKYRKATELEPNDAMSHLRWGMALDQTKKYIEAIEKFKRAIEIDANYVAAYERWGYVLQQMGRRRESNAKYAQARQLQPPG